MKELWKTIDGFEYEVSNTGKVRNDKSKKILYQATGNGYASVSLSKRGKRKILLVHRLVAEAFCINAWGKQYVNHIDSDRTNNTSKNLEWCTRSENAQRSYVEGKNNKAKLSDEDARAIYWLAFYSNLSYRVIAKHFDISQCNVSRITNGKSYLHLGFKPFYREFTNSKSTK